MLGKRKSLLQRVRTLARRTVNDLKLRNALKAQYHAGLGMLAECVEKCPESMWLEGEHPRAFWRIAFHAAFFTHLYLGQNEETFPPWPDRREGIHPRLWDNPDQVEPYELPEEAQSYGMNEILAYLRFIDGLVDPTVDQLDLDSDEALYVPAVDRLVARVPNAARLKESILSHHTSVEDAGRVAEAAGVKTLVLSHFVPPDDPDVTDQMWIDAARTTYRGRIIVGKDLLEI